MRKQLGLFTVFCMLAAAPAAAHGDVKIAGDLCSPWFFSTSWQGDQVPQAVGEYLNQKGVKSIYVIAPNYAAGDDKCAMKW